MSAAFDIRERELPGLFEISPVVHTDARGSFVKTFETVEFEAAGLARAFAETYYTVSRERVVRGLHCQLPPSDHDKLVHCCTGRVLDVVVDLRRDSPTFGRCASTELDPDRATMVYVPTGMAHGFLVLEAPALLCYQVTTSHDPSRDGGVRWDSVPFEWPFADAIVSARDAALPSLDAFDSPFCMPARP